MRKVALPLMLAEKDYYTTAYKEYAEPTFEVVFCEDELQRIGTSKIRFISGDLCIREITGEIMMLHDEAHGTSFLLDVTGDHRFEVDSHGARLA